MSDLPTHPPPAYPPPPPLAEPDPSPRPRRRRRLLPLVLALVAALALVAVAVGAPLVDQRDVPDGPVDLSAVQEYDDLEPSHTDQDVDYPQSPPVGGPHAPVWLDCGVYDEPVRDENAVHDLEHGTVWITYGPDLAEGEVAALADLLPQNGILSPYDGLAAPVVVTVWGRQLALTGADDPRLPLFLTAYAGGETAPEPTASCAGGVRSADGENGTAV